MKALGLLALLVALHYGYVIFDPADRAQAWNICLLYTSDAADDTR